MPIANRLLLAFIIFEIAVLATLPARADEPIKVPLSAQERTAIQEACASALWANRQKFDGLCDYLRAKFDAAEKADKAAVPANPDVKPKENP